MERYQYQKEIKVEGQHEDVFRILDTVNTWDFLRNKHPTLIAVCEKEADAKSIVDALNFAD